MKNILLILTAGLLFSSGIIRDDVPKDKYLELAQQKQFDCVGRAFYGNRALGSCILIGKKYILSAAHVFTIDEERAKGMAGAEKKVFDKSTFFFLPMDSICFKFKGPDLYKAKAMTVHKSFAAPWTCDMILIELNEEIKDIIPASLNTRFDELHAVGFGVGHGASGPAGKPELVEMKFEKIAGENEIDLLWGFEIDGKPTLMTCDFDHPTDSMCCNKIGSSKPLAMEYISTGGDSGGGMFIFKDGQWTLAGVLSGGGVDLTQFEKTGYYGQRMQWLRVSAFANWIKSNAHL